MAFSHCPSVQVVLVERAGGSEQAANIPVPGFCPEPADCDEMVSVWDVFPGAVFGDGLEHLDSGAPPFLGCLPEVAGGESRSGLLQKMLAGLSMLLGGHLGTLPAVSAG